MGRKQRVDSKISDSEARANAFDALRALRGILKGTDAEEHLAAERRKDEERLEAWARGEDYVRRE
jgi:hypothetical protein